jgi:hypothetical protein
MRNFRDRALSARHASLRSSSKVEDCTRSTSLSTLKTSKSEIMLPAFIVQFSEHESPYNKLNWTLFTKNDYFLWMKTFLNKLHIL